MPVLLMTGASGVRRVDLFALCMLGALHLLTAPAHAQDRRYQTIPITRADEVDDRATTGLSIDHAGATVAYSIVPTGTTRILDVDSGAEHEVFVPLASSNGQKLTPDGGKFFFRGIFEVQGSLRTRIGYIDLRDNSLHNVPLNTSSSEFDVSASGERVVFQAPGTTLPQGVELQFFLYDFTKEMLLQLTNDVGVIRNTSDSFSCPDSSGTRPLISSDGETVVIATSSTMGLVEADDSVGCYIHRYDIVSAEWTKVAAVPAGVAILDPSLSADGRFLVFLARKETLPHFSPGWIDLRDGNLRLPAISHLTSDVWDAVITPDGESIVFSSQEDLDASGNNSDGNLELFRTELGSSGEVVQLTDTEFGLDGALDNCAPYGADPSRDGSMVVGGFSRVRAGSCDLTEPQRLVVEGVSLTRFRVIRSRSQNQAVLIEGPERSYSLVGHLLTLPFTTLDADDDLTTMFAQLVGGVELPAGASISSPAQEGTSVLSWTPEAASAGINELRVVAFDEGGSSASLVTEVAVCQNLRAADDLVAQIFMDIRPPDCSRGDLNGDFRVSAADLVGRSLIDLPDPFAAFP